jgi:hypothetical protein
LDGRYDALPQMRARLLVCTAPPFTFGRTARWSPRNHKDDPIGHGSIAGTIWDSQPVTPNDFKLRRVTLNDCCAWPSPRIWLICKALTTVSHGRGHRFKPCTAHQIKHLRVGYGSAQAKHPEQRMSGTGLLVSGQTEHIAITILH